MHADLSVVILAAGQGTRMKSSRAKVLHTLGGQPLVCFPIERARELGAARIVVVLGHQHAEVTAVIEQRFGADAVEVALQLEQLGTAHASGEPRPRGGAARARFLLSPAAVPLLPGAAVRGLGGGGGRGGRVLAAARPTAPHG